MVFSVNFYPNKSNLKVILSLSKQSFYLTRRKDKYFSLFGLSISHKLFFYVNKRIFILTSHKQK